MRIGGRGEEWKREWGKVMRENEFERKEVNELGRLKEGRLGQVKLGQIRSGQIGSGQVRLDQVRLDQIRSD